MEALPLSLLAFAAGVYLLIKVKKEYLSGLFSYLAWFVIAASFVSIGFASIECVDEFCEEFCEPHKECRIEKEIIMKDGEGGACHHDRHGDGMMEGCKMEGDSCVMDRELCEKMMGKEACDSIYKLRGRCIMSEDECMKMCHPKGGCMGGKTEGGCGMHHEGGMKEGKGGCCMGKSEGKKSCCSKKSD